MPSFYKSLALLCGLSLVAAPAFADEWQPEGPIRLLIGFGAGGGTDTQARALVTELSEKQLLCDSDYSVFSIENRIFHNGSREAGLIKGFKSF